MQLQHSFNGQRRQRAIFYFSTAEIGLNAKLILKEITDIHHGVLTEKTPFLFYGNFTILYRYSPCKKIERIFEHPECGMKWGGGCICVQFDKNKTCCTDILKLS